VGGRQFFRENALLIRRDTLYYVSFACSVRSVYCRGRNEIVFCVHAFQTIINCLIIIYIVVTHYTQWIIYVCLTEIIILLRSVCICINIYKWYDIIIPDAPLTSRVGRFLSVFDSLRRSRSGRFFIQITYYVCSIITVIYHLYHRPVVIYNDILCFLTKYFNSNNNLINNK